MVERNFVYGTISWKSGGNFDSRPGQTQPIKEKINKLASSRLMFALLKTLIRGKGKLHTVTKKIVRGILVVMEQFCIFIVVVVT